MADSLPNPVRRGIPYTLREVKLVSRDHAMDPYHRDLMQYAVACAEKAEALLRQISNARWAFAVDGGGPTPVECLQVIEGWVAAYFTECK